MSLISRYCELAGKKPDAETLKNAFRKVGELAEQEPPTDDEWYAFAMYIQKQPWFKDPEMLRAISEEDETKPGIRTMPLVFCEAREVVRLIHNKLAVQVFPKLPFVRQNYIVCICQHIMDRKKTGRSMHVIFTDGKCYPDEMLVLPDGWLRKPEQAMVETEIVLAAWRGGIIVFKHDAPIKERKLVCAFYFSHNTQCPLSEDELKKKKLTDKGEIGYKAIV